jgi:isopentenyldiphosphate isomerase
VPGVDSTDDATEAFPLVDEDGRRVGIATRGACHADPALLHPAVHVLVRTADGMLWQLRGHRKDVAPGVWDHACAGHVRPDEAPVDTAVRELGEELGLAVDAAALHEIGVVVVRLPNESELTTIFELRHDGPFVLAPPEVAGLAVLPFGVRPTPLPPGAPEVHAWLDEHRPGWDR